MGARQKPNGTTMERREWLPRLAMGPLFITRRGRKFLIGYPYRYSYIMASLQLFVTKVNINTNIVRSNLKSLVGVVGYHVGLISSYMTALSSRNPKAASSSLARDNYFLLGAAAQPVVFYWMGKQVLNGLYMFL